MRACRVRSRGPWWAYQFATRKAGTPPKLGRVVDQSEKEKEELNTPTTLTVDACTAMAACMAMAVFTKLLAAVVFLQFLLSPSHSQQTGAYPSVASVATYRPVTADSVCGSDGPEQYCQYTTDTAVSQSLGLLPSCIEATCDNTCPYSDSSPTGFRLAAAGTLGSGVTAALGRESGEQTAFRFQSSSVEVPASAVPLLSENGFTFAAWINRESSDTRGTLVSKSSPDSDSIERNYVVSVEQGRVIFDYLPDTLDLSSLQEGSQRYRTVIVDGVSLPAGVWHHVAITVYAEDAAVYVNGTVEGVQALEGTMVDANRTVLLGQTSNGVGSFSGRMESMYLYTQALTQREVQELYKGSLPFSYLSTECHCPPSHTVIDLDDETRCIQHDGGDLVSRGAADRINPLAHPPGFINDLNVGVGNGWISSPGDHQASITLNLTNSFYELIFINFRFGSPRFKAAVMETSRDGGLTFEPIHYFADDCMNYFSLPDNGVITAADSVTCTTSESLQMPTYGVDVRTRLLDPQTRPFDLNTSPELRNFILSSHLRLRLVDLFTENTSPGHEYYNILEITVAARCACNGHSSRCGSSIDSVCECAHNTQGDTCDQCLPLFNDKPWRYGETDNAYPCKMCDCNGHADSCHYNASLDPFPDSYDQGGGGVCDNCQSNTAGQHCENCAFAYFREPGVDQDDSNPCTPCDCDPRGDTNNGDCVKSEGIPGQVVGQCQCKANVIGLKCNQCEEGFFALSASNRQGCSPCNCNTDGTVSASDACHATTGQCSCKANVMGLKCDQCVNGTTRLSALNVDGCSFCECDSIGSLSTVCDTVAGACECKPGVGGNNCDECLDGYFGFSDEGCQPCMCNERGSTSTLCDKEIGACVCRPNVEGRVCDTCSGGYYNLSAGCVDCGCNTDGTVDGNATCLQDSGQCPCKENVEGRTCGTCSSGFTALSGGNPAGCEACNCSELGTDLSGSICDPLSSQCECLPSATGHRCDSCVSGFRITQEGCVECDCNPNGSSSSVCDIGSGECPCNEGVDGERCDFCISGFFNFPSCEPCNCDSAGTVDGAECDVVTGVCNCKMFVMGATCNTCLLGYQQLDVLNPFGCSAAPDEQGPPTTTLRASTYIELTWSPPEMPNGVILGYQVYRNNSNIANTTETVYDDTGLTPNTYYSYYIESFNVIDSTVSSEVVFKTLEGIPTGISAPALTVLNSTSIFVMWMEPTVTHGAISRYILLVQSEGSEYIEVFRGNVFSYVVTNLRPFTSYSFIVQACTNGGCGSSTSSQNRTAQAPPTFQPAPTVTTLGATELLLQWEAPAEPNGIILGYVVNQREAPFDGDGVSVETVDEATRSLVVDGLRPFTRYQYQVESYTEAGGTESEWSDGRTGEAAPSEVYPPEVRAVSSTSLQVNWTEPASPNGIITNYSIFNTTTGGDRDSLLTSSSSPGSLVLSGLEPFTEYGFLVEVCTVAGCSTSEVQTGRTGESAPAAQPHPTAMNVNATSVELTWEAPAQPNGIISNYTVHRRTPSLLPTPARNDVGVSFTGTGYATFAPSSPSSFENNLSLRFRTLGCCGILFYTINAAETDMFAVELRDGVPWFVFDAGSGPGVVRAESDARFDDSEWHTLTVNQRGNTGTVAVDGTHTGSGESEGLSTVIGYTTHHVGGLPPDAALRSLNADPNSQATLSGESFAGCLYNVLFNEVLLDFSAGFSGVGSPDRGCPVDLTRTMQLLGGGYFSLVENIVTGNSFNVSFWFRTTHSDGLLFLMSANGETRCGIELRDSNLRFVIANTDAVVLERPCDGEWHSITIRQEDTLLLITVDEELSESYTLPDSESEILSSRIFFGGVPSDSGDFSMVRDASLNTDAPFSGCIRLPEPFLYVNNQPVVGTVAESEFVNFDGCGSTAGASCVPSWHKLDAGAERRFTDTDLTPFSAYLYRVVAMNTAGSAYSAWQSTATSQSAPADVGVVSLLTATSTSLVVTWSSPEVPNGLITEYSVEATPYPTTEGHTGAMDTLSITEPEQRLEATLDNLIPFTNYSVTLWASTSAGIGVGPVVILTTRESAPEGVQPAYVTVFGSRSLTLSWRPPNTPNGLITEYTLYVDGVERFSGRARTTTVGSLMPSTQYTFLVQACTIAGCSNSSESSNTTLPDRPDGLDPPVVTPLTPTALEITWSPPDIPNGEMLNYQLQQVTDNGDVIEVLFSDIGFSYELTGLTPNTVYRFRVLATNAGGTTASEVGQNTTLEDAPDGLSPPVTTVVNSTAINIKWQEPSQPNGVITEYILSRNGTEIFRGITLILMYTDTALQPFTYYSYYIQACTSGNCSASTPTVARTDEAIPEGIVPLSITFVASDTVSFTVNEVTRPNGIVCYVVALTGVFSSIPGSIEETREVFNDTEVGTEEVEGLVPFTRYQIVLTVSNSAGTLSGEVQTFTTDPAAPEGLLPPDLFLLDATTLAVSWSAPEQPNDNITRYELKIYNNTDSSLILDQGQNTSAVVYNLRPFTNYSICLTVYNSVGNTSATSRIRTGETAPTGFDEVIVERIQARSVFLLWEAPAQPNGVLVIYIVLQNEREIANVTPPTVEYNVTGLLPYTDYQFSIQACTSAGCVEGPSVDVTTLEDVPEGVEAPTVRNGLPGQVLVTWSVPSHPNGELLQYFIQRAQNGGQEYSNIRNQSAAMFRVYGDTGLRPYTNYSYRIVAVNGAGSTVGPSSSILTPEAAPEGVFAPVLSVLSTTSIEVAFQPPSIPNGVIVSYSLTRQSPSTSTPTTITLDIDNLPYINGSFFYMDTSLSPFTNFTYFLTVCTSATDGCSKSDAVWAVTDEAIPSGLQAPVVSTVNESSILVSWEQPTQPNGIIGSFILLQRSFGFDVPANLEILTNCCEDYLNTNHTVVGDSCSRVAFTDGTVFSYTVLDLEAFSNYRYCIAATNSAGSTFSPSSNVIQTSAAPMPISGPNLNASTVNSTAIFLLWTSLDVSQLLGPFDGYTLYGRVAGDSAPGEIFFSGEEQDYTATDLVASTEYIFQVSVSNGRGSTFSSTASATTEEGIPANLSAPRVEVVSATAIQVSWSAPNEPNGVIISYTIFLNSVVYHNQSSPGSLTIDGLAPYSEQTVRVQACTRFGCTLSPLVTVRTFESAPVGLASPTVQITGPYSTNISWVPPTEPNGIITSYQLFQREGISGEPTLIFSGLALRYVAMDLLPFTLYGFEVYAINGGGNVSSGVTVSTTDEARPTSVDAPTATVVSATDIELSWREPQEINGMLIGYNLYRNSIPLLTFESRISYTDSNLEPFTDYTYSVEACTNAGCTSSDSVTNTTLEAVPEMVSQPTFLEVQARSLVVAWEEPGRRNGIITQYVLYQVDDGGNITVLSDGLEQMVALDNLTPFTTYSFYVDTCNSAGCTSSPTVSETTLQAPPQGVRAPIVRNLSSTSASIEWVPPYFPNGDITNYTIRRGTEDGSSVIVFKGLALSYIDMGLLANTFYSYTVTANNAGGSTESAPSYIHTIPDLAGGIVPPNVTVLGPTSIRVTWAPPEFPNGEILLYILHMDNVAVFSGIGFEYSREDLTPFTTYTFFYEVRNQAGSAGSVSVAGTTEPSEPEGVTPPTLVVLGSSAIRVEWQQPSLPNGIISEYRVRRRLYDNVPTEFIHFVTQDTSVMVFQNSGLDPYTRYEYRLEVFNQAGSTLSEFADVRTEEDIPEGVFPPNILSSNIMARNLSAIWSVPTHPNGVITGYKLEYRLLLDPMTNLPGEVVTAAETSASVTTATAVGLLPVTTYEFRVVAINGAGEGFSQWEVVTTAEDIPEGITEIVVESRTSSSLSLSWGLPDRPNGEIREYILLLDGEIEHQTQLTTYQVTRLQPFTTYSLQLGACTSAGCAYGIVQLAGTEEAPPVGQATPTVTALGPRTVQITWEPPSQVNGIILLYEILRQQDESTPTAILSTSDTVTREFEDVFVLPATTYGYSIAVNNSAGRVASEYKTITTPEAAPEGITAPVLTVISSSSIEVSWSTPSQPNGVISQYQVFRDGGGMQNVSVYVGLNRQFTDSNLTPFTQYSYIIQACTSGGCDLSPSATDTTLEALPEGFDDSSVQASPLTSTSIRVSWSVPLLPNGIIRNYSVVVSDGFGSIPIVRLDLSTDVTNLQPYTDYTVTVGACNSVGCAEGTTVVRTLEDVPQFIAAPFLLALNPTTVYVQWEQPARPNGVITSYTLRRDGLTIIEGNIRAYNDTNLLPNQGYSYTVQAFTSVGGSQQSPSSFVQTPPDTPEDISAPTLTVLGSDRIMAEWEVPGQPNGEIRSYILIVNGTVVFESPSVLEFRVEGLAPFTIYVFRVDACTTTCGNSSYVTERTGEATPTGQTPPRLSAPFQNTTVLAVWDPPAEPNGIIILYELRRRLVPDGDYILVYSGPDPKFRDSGVDLRPAMVYQYQVTSANSVDSVTSDSSAVTLPDAPPEGVQAPVISDITSTSLTATAAPPATPNGELTSYLLYQNGTILSEQVPSGQDSVVVFGVGGLLPFTIYTYRVEVCTVGGCGSSDQVTIRTLEDVPQEFDVVPVGVTLSARSILVTWSPPSRPNGIITGYKLWYRLACPQPEQPELAQSTATCTEGPLVLVTSTDQTQFTVTGSTVADPFPYSRYQFLVEARNSIGAVNSSFSSSVETETSVPEVSGSLEFTANQTTGIIRLNWGSTFRPNGPVQRYILTRNGIALLSRPTTSVVLSNEPRATDLRYVVTIQTTVGEASTDAVTLRLQELSTSSSDTPTVATDDSSESETLYYREAAFITGMVILAVCLVFIAGAIFLCFVRPRGDPGFPVSPHSLSTHLDVTPTKHSPVGGIPMQRLVESSSPTKHDHSLNLTRQSRGTMAGSWSPGDPIWEDLPDVGEEDNLLVSPRKQKSYSPRREEKARLLEEEVLPDTHIAGYESGSIPRHGPHYTTLAKEDFGTFRASQTTFADTKV